MLIKSEYDIQFHLTMPTPMMAMLHLHPSLEPQVRAAAGTLHITAATVATLAMPAISVSLFIANPPMTFLASGAAVAVPGHQSCLFPNLILPLHRSAASSAGEAWEKG